MFHACVGMIIFFPLLYAALRVAAKQLSNDWSLVLGHWSFAFLFPPAFGLRASAGARSFDEAVKPQSSPRSHDAALSLIFQPVRGIDSSFNATNPLQQCIF
jgi:hypothetical protein